MIYFSGGYFDLFFRYLLLREWPCIDSWLSFFLSSVYFLYVLFRPYCYEYGLCVCWTISIGGFTELVQTIYNARFSVKTLANLVLLIVIHLLFTELVSNQFSEQYLLSSIEKLFQLIHWTRFNPFMNHSLSQLDPIIFVVSWSSIQWF